MKILKTTLLLLAILIANTTFSQTMPNKKETWDYLKNKFNSTSDYIIEYKEGLSAKLEPIYLYDFGAMKLKRKMIGETYYYEYNYDGIDFAKLISINENDNEDIKSNSSVKRLTLIFVNNSIKFKGYLIGGNDPVWDRYSNGVVQSFIPFYYRDEPGEKEKVIKAIQHLSRLCKEEAKANDPFGN